MEPTLLTQLRAELTRLLADPIDVLHRESDNCYIVFADKNYGVLTEAQAERYLKHLKKLASNVGPVPAIEGVSQCQ